MEPVENNEVSPTLTKNSHKIDLKLASALGSPGGMEDAPAEPVLEWSPDAWSGRESLGTTQRSSPGPFGTRVHMGIMSYYY